MTLGVGTFLCQKLSPILVYFAFPCKLISQPLFLSVSEIDSNQYKTLLSVNSGNTGQINCKSVQACFYWRLVIRMYVHGTHS